MDLAMFADYIPTGIIIAIISVVMLTEATKLLLGHLECYLEEKKGKQIKFFDHTKIILTIVWSIVMTIVCVKSEVIEMNKCLLYFFVIIGAASCFYELILKKINRLLISDE